MASIFLLQTTNESHRIASLQKWVCILSTFTMCQLSDRAYADPVDLSADVSADYAHLDEHQIKKVTPFEFGAGISYDSNLNGGIPAERLSILGVDFIVDPQRRAESGIAAFLDFESQAKWAISNTLVTSAALEGRFSYSPKNNTEKLDLSLRLCALHDLGDRWFSDSCVSHTYGNRELGSFNATRIGVELGRHFNTAESLNLASVRPLFERVNERWRLLTDFKWQRMRANGEFLSVSSSLGTKPEGVMGVVGALEVMIGRDFLERSTSISLRVEQLRGETVFGDERTDERTTIRVTRELSNAGELELGFDHNWSTIEEFGNFTGVFGVNFSF